MYISHATLRLLVVSSYCSFAATSLSSYGLIRLICNIMVFPTLHSISFQVFKKYGIEKFDPTNEPFDPHRHHALFQVSDPSKPPGTVAQVLKVCFMEEVQCFTTWHQ